MRQRQPLLRKVLGILIFLAGAFLIVTCQGWGFWLIDIVGPERALGAANVRREPDGSVLMTNPGGMLLWCLPFLVLGILFVAIGVKVFRLPRPAE